MAADVGLPMRLGFEGYKQRPDARARTHTHERFAHMCMRTKTRPTLSRASVFEPFDSVPILLLPCW